MTEATTVATVAESDSDGPPKLIDSSSSDEVPRKRINNSPDSSDDEDDATLLRALAEAFVLLKLAAGKPMCGSCCKRRDVMKNVCGQCRSVYYCDRECQKKHWIAGHRLSCVSVADAAADSDAAELSRLPFPEVD